MICRFDIVALADPQTLPRVLGCFAQRWLVPDRVVARREGDAVHIRLELAEIDEGTAAIVLAKLCEAVMVESAARAWIADAQALPAGRPVPVRAAQAVSGIAV
ncbi:MAG: hypothetical protein J0H88_23790 [Sphingomonadales bacterium]|nr:hypothetical protein [Sphingomonadales bacterium]